MEQADDDFLDAARHVARVVGERARVVPIDVDAIHPVFRAGSLLIRIEVSEVAAEVASRVDNCRRMAAAGVPFVMPVTDEPIALPGCEELVATAWEYTEPIPPLDWTAYGTAVAVLHAFDGLTIPAVAVVERFAGAIESHSSLDPGTADRFCSLIAPLDELLAEVGWSDLPLVPSHGDLWTKNVIPRGPHGVVLCDPDFLGSRPAASDLALVFRETAGDDRWQRFLDGYGRDCVPTPGQLEAGWQAAAANWATYVLEHRRDWMDYTEYLADGAERLAQRNAQPNQP